MLKLKLKLKRDRGWICKGVKRGGKRREGEEGNRRRRGEGA